MDFDADAFTRILAGRLAAIVPDGFWVRAEDGMLWYSAETGRFPGQSGDYSTGEAGTYARDNLRLLGEDSAQSLAQVAAHALDELQDFISEATHDPWPGDRAQPRACAEVRGEMLHLWYGGPAEPVLACEPVPLADLRRSR